MFEKMPEEARNSEGYCKKCGAALGISGFCAACAIEADGGFDQALKKLHSRFKCPICGSPMTHYRLRGYQCHIEEHNTRRHELERQRIDDVVSGKITDTEFDAWLDGEE